MGVVKLVVNSEPPSEKFCLRPWKLMIVHGRTYYWWVSTSYWVWSDSHNFQKLWNHTWTLTSIIFIWVGSSQGQLHTQTMSQCRNCRYWHRVTKWPIKTTSYHSSNAIVTFLTLGVYSFSKITMSLIPPRWYQMSKIGPLAHGLLW